MNRVLCAAMSYFYAYSGLTPRGAGFPVEAINSPPTWDMLELPNEVAEVIEVNRGLCPFVADGPLFVSIVPLPFLVLFS